MNLKSIAISIPTLKSLTIDDFTYSGSEEDLNGCEIKIYAANLLSLKYTGYLLNQFFLCNLSSLVNASIQIPFVHMRQKEIAYRSVRLLRGLHHVKSVRISNGTIESLSLAGNVLDHLPVYQNLTYLELSTQIKNHSVGALMDLLQRLPNLESLVFAEGLDPSMYLYEDDWILKPVPKCFLSCLKSVSLQNFHGNLIELCFLEFLLENALVLERMKIFYSKNPYGDPKMQKEVSNQLQILPRGSADCLIMFL
ncbi:hypothetical protein F0562_008818 [Nyssa sinensis]|uniref:FBD domain-containing protein n=1 Tax=Nyssa sinensis TaxID=561372 RepID=A0A5J5A7R6_9ASTE|nr:hypothetical protein F0562_008818 [Nyssa sinensis]